MTMKKISIKGIRVSSHHHSQRGSQGECEGEYQNKTTHPSYSCSCSLQLQGLSEQNICRHKTNIPIQSALYEEPNGLVTSDCPVGLQTLDISEQPVTNCQYSSSKKPTTTVVSSCRPPKSMSTNQLHPHCHSFNGTVKWTANHQMINVINEEPHQKKRERLGLFRNLRRKFSSFRKSEAIIDCNGHIEEINSISNNPSPVVSNSRLKESSKTSFNSRTNATSQSCDSLNKTHKSFTSPKFNEWHSNTDRLDVDGIKDKPGCFSKDISHFRPTSSHHSEDCINDKDHSGAEMAVHSKDSEKNVVNEPCYELADCVEYDPVKEQTKIWSPKVWSLTQELFRLSKFGWYWGPITRNEAEEKLTNQPDGAFLVRDSSDERYLLSLSFRSYGRTLHTRIEHCNGVFSFYAQPDSEGYSSIVDLIEHSMNESQTGIFYYSRSRSPGAPHFPVWLTKPVSRFTQVRSLQYLCRFVIRQYTRYDHIQQLPLPTTLKGWIEENQY